MFRGEDAGTICVCKDGYTGDPDSSKGCQSVGLISNSELQSGDRSVQAESCQVLK